ncbi:hypothetical protein NDU88_004189 [Pleurodeles waltl]|uniref:Uncharacterized protein n=1 Tax=Pleurodeles waltl TaxID=8319 RepID=A0AAV7V3Z5_PLEWA|nr:hypothetical protein NDU88_004189 [Pleurodeles waltl]
MTPEARGDAWKAAEQREKEAASKNETARGLAKKKQNATQQPLRSAAAVEGKAKCLRQASACSRTFETSARLEQ